MRADDDGFIFQSTLPVGGATTTKGADSPRNGDFNPRSPWGERLHIVMRNRVVWHFNPRSPWGERLEPIANFRFKRLISIHAPRGGSDRGLHCYRRPPEDFNPRSPWGERPSVIRLLQNDDEFQSTLPVGGATKSSNSTNTSHHISIHAPRGGSDPRSLPLPRIPGDFNPRSPWGERRLPPWPGPPGHLFQSTLPVGGATGGYYQPVVSSNDFNPRSPWGERPLYLGWYFHPRIISIHAPRGGSDCQVRVLYAEPEISIHAPRGGSDFPHAAAPPCPVR